MSEDVFDNVEFEPIGRIEVTDDQLEEDAIIRIIQRKRLEAIVNGDQGMTSEFIKLMADTVKTSIDLKRIVADADDSDADRTLAKSLVEFVASQSAGNFRHPGAGNDRVFDETAIPEIEVFDGYLDDTLHHLSHDGEVTEE